LVEARARFVEPRAHPPKSGAWCGKQKAKRRAGAMCGSAAR